VSNQVTPGTKKKEAEAVSGRVAPIKNSIEEEKKHRVPREAASDQELRVKVQSANVEGQSCRDKRLGKLVAPYRLKGLPKD
jgi:hypothetical protein